MAYMHRETFEIFQDGVESDVSLTSNFNYFHVDDLIALPIQVLNRKGYTTEMCCSGHLFDVKDITVDLGKLDAWKAERDSLTGLSNTQIALKALNDDEFREEYNKKMKEISIEHTVPNLISCITFRRGVTAPSLPPGFYVEKDPGLENRFIIVKEFDANDDKYALMREITDTMEQLYHWALSLPDNN